MQNIAISNNFAVGGCFEDLVAAFIPAPGPWKTRAPWVYGIGGKGLVRRGGD